MGGTLTSQGRLFHSDSSSLLLEPEFDMAVALLRCCLEPDLLSWKEPCLRKIN